ncbi:MAG TPA: hypothetical protein VE548_11120 [Nitrososphaeraceae archaeon]|nr:hypothetical protein [Nitrososphaeraceae archaeon]
MLFYTIIDAKIEEGLSYVTNNSVANELDNIEFDCIIFVVIVPWTSATDDYMITCNASVT